MPDASSTVSGSEAAFSRPPACGAREKGPGSGRLSGPGARGMPGYFAVSVPGQRAVAYSVPFCQAESPLMTSSWVRSTSGMCAAAASYSPA